MSRNAYHVGDVDVVVVLFFLVKRKLTELLVAHPFVLFLPATDFLKLELFFDLAYVSVSGIEQFASFLGSYICKFLSTLLFEGEPSNSVLKSDIPFHLLMQIHLLLVALDTTDNRRVCGMPTVGEGPIGHALVGTH